MVAVEQTPDGQRLFARYAHAPNALGYCGPAGAQALLDAATGRPAADLHDIARRFSGAWPYQQLLAEMLAVDDPLDAEVVRGYWTGNARTRGLDRVAYGRALIGRLAPQAGHYWKHLTDDLLPEAAPSHAFHVLAVYPWSRMLDLGPEPLQVLESCRIGWGEVIEVESDELVVSSPQLKYDAGVLDLGEPRERRVAYRIDGRAFIDDVRAGDVVALHWDFACDLLDDEERALLEEETRRQLEAMAPRIR